MRADAVAALPRQTVDRGSYRAPGHFCLRCGQPWALRADRELDEAVDGARITAWVIACRFCDYRRSVITVEAGGERITLVSESDVVDA